MDASGSLGDQGVLGLQLRQQGTDAELRMRWGQGAGVVEATLKETGRGVEIHLAAGPDQQGMLHRVAETLAARRGEHDFDLDGVEVDASEEVETAPHADLGQGRDQGRDRDRDQGRDRDPSRSGPPAERDQAGSPIRQSRSSYCR